MEDDFSDILGGNTIPVVRGTQSRWSRLSFGDYTFILGALLVCYVVGLRLWEALLLWREKSYKLSIRRRHGIPDDDHRPFNVAFAAAVRAREAKERGPRSDQALRGQEPQTALQEQALRQRGAYSQSVPSARSTQLSNTLPPRPQSTNSNLAPWVINAPLRSHSTTASPTRPVNLYQDQYHISRPSHHESDPGPLPSTTRRVSRKNMEIIVDGNKKRSFDGDEPDTNDQVKKTRIEGGEYIDGDEDAEWQERERITQRGSKRGPGEEDDGEAFSLKRARDKRARKISLESAHDVGYEMDVDYLEEQDDVSELKSVARGKKRDRAEAGSTFGGDDYDSTVEAEAEDDSKDRRRRRKRRSVTKRKSDVGKPVHGQKRDRDAEAESDVEIDDSVHRKSRKKRGKKSSLSGHSDEEDRRNGSDVSMEESPSKTRGKRVGEEWESNGVRYKLSPNGQRLQQVLIKRARQKFPMPKDSQHPDRQANLEVYVETWLSEEELKEAKAQHLLAWQESPKTSVEPETPASEPQDRASEICEGKDLLWNSTSKAPASALPSLPSTPQRGAFRQALVPVGSLQRSLYQRQELAGKRVSSTGRVTFSGLGQPATPGAASAGLTESVNGKSRTTPRVFSKWEKQDLEANAMMKMREANRKKEAEKEQKAKEEREKADRERLEKEKAEKEKKARESAAAAAPTVPSITVTQPSEDVAKAPTPLAPSVAVGEAKEAAAKPLFGPAPGIAAPPFSFPQFKAPAAAPAKPKERQPEKLPTAAAESQPAFSFGAPPVAPSVQPPSFGLTPVVPAEKKPEQPQPAAASPFAPPSTAPTAPSFSFGPSPTQAPQTPEKKEPASQTGSLLSRLGPPQPEKAAALPATTTSAFSFAKPSTSPFGTTTTPQQPPPAAQPAMPAGATTAPKFSFSFGKPATTPSTAPAPVLPASDAMDVNSKPSQPTFSFKQAAPTADTTTPTPKFTFGAAGSGIAFSPGPPSSSASGATSGAAAQKFSSVTPASNSGSAFGPMTTPTSGTLSSEAPKTAFTFGATTTPTRPPFGATGTSVAGSEPSVSGGQAKSPFGVFGGAASGTTQTGTTFGMTSQAPKMDGAAPSTDVSKPIFGGGATAGGSLFGANRPASGSTTAGVASGEAGKPTFSFGGSGSAFGATSTTGQANKPSFSFGGAGTTTGSTMGTTGLGTQPASSPFSATSNIFGGSSGDAANKSVFGSTSAAKPEQPKPAFSFGSTASSTTDGTKEPVFSFGKPSATSTSTAATGSATPFSFGFGNAPKNISTSSTQPSSVFSSQAASTSDSSGFGNPSTTTTSTPATFTFGKPAAPSEGQQQQ